MHIDPQTGLMVGAVPPSGGGRWRPPKRKLTKGDWLFIIAIIVIVTPFGFPYSTALALVAALVYRGLRTL